MIISVSKATEAAEVLDVKLENLTSKDVKRAYRDKAKECHPDHHGQKQLALWARVSWAKECLIFWLAQNPPREQDVTLAEDACRACGGVGRVKVAGRRFGAPLTMACVLCKGMGTIIPEEDDHD